MRRALIAALAMAGCNGLFEGNPEFVEGGTASSTGNAATSGADDGADDSGASAESTAAPASTSTGGEVGSSGDPDGGQTSTGDACEADAFELNDEVSDAFGLDNITSTTPAIEIEAALEGTGAVDWYAFNADQLDMAPRAVKVLTQTEDVRVCAYLKCSDLTPAEIDCGSDEPSTAPNGFPGCCGIGEARPIHQCNMQPGGDVNVWVRVSDAADRNECLPYSYTYSFVSP